MIPDTPSQCLTFALLRAARSAARRLDGALRPLGLTAQQFSTLAILREAETLPISRVAEHLGTDRTTVTRNITVLQRRGLVSGGATQDARVHALSLTEAGEALLNEALPLWAEVQDGLKQSTESIAFPDLLGTLRKV